MNEAVDSIWTINHERAIHLDRPFLIGVLNITPDSFSDGGVHDTPTRALEHARVMVDEGADALDIGGESTRPGAQRIDSDEQIRRVIPVIEAIRAAGIDLPISIDTTRATVARAALDAGADAINDVSAGAEDSGMLTLAGERGCGLILMHRERPPEQDQFSDQYTEPPVAGSVRGRVIEALRGARDRALAAGVEPGCIMLDPGLGFGKNVAQNLELIRCTPELVALGHPVLSALSRKSFVGRVSLGRDSSPDERLEGTLACSVLHLSLGARCFRVHDVAAHRAALDAGWAVVGYESGGNG
jgi:dihydropteroate synthase